MWQKHAVGLAVAGILSATNAYALGLGEIKVNSALNEPLSAEVQLLQVKQLNALQIHPRMADVNDYALAGLDRPYFLSGIRFQVKVQPDGTGKIFITSDQPMREPFLNFLMEVNWPNGRLVREYTLLLDPPVFEPAPVKQQVSPAASSTTAVPEKKPIRAETVTPPATQSSRITTSAPTPNTQTTAAAPSEVRVGRKDTLWALAIQNKPQGISAQQLMMAWLKKNPDAFIDGNINRVKANAILKMPTADELAAITPEMAANEVTRQTQLWQTKRAAPAPQAVAPAEPEEPATPQPTEPVARAEESAPAEEAELKVVAPEEPVDGVAQADDAESEAVASAAEETAEDPLAMLQAQNQDLEQRLNESLEAADQATRENEALNQRLDAIQQQLESLQRMLELKDQELARLQSEFAKAQAEPKAETDVLKQILSSPMVLIGLAAGLVILLLGALFAMRKRKSSEAAEETPEASAATAVAATAAAAVAADAIADETPAEEEAADTEEVVADEPAPEPEAAPNINEDTDLSEFDDLDLDMDLDLEEDDTARVLGTLQEDQDDGEVLMDDDEFDLSLPEEEAEPDAEPEAESAEVPADDIDIDSELDSILGESEPEETVESEPEVDLSSDLDDILGDAEPVSVAEEDLSLEEVMAESDQLEALADAESLDDLLEDESDAESPVTAAEEPELTVDDDLEFDLDDLSPEPEPVAEAVTETVEEDELEFDLADIPESPEEIAQPTEESAEEALDFDLDLDLDLPGEPAAEAPAEPAPELAADDLDLDLELDQVAAFTEETAAELEQPVATEPAEIDLSEQLDTELDELLGASDNEIELEESGNDDQDEDFDALAGLNLLEGADEVETKLDLARAYIDMEDLEGAKDILQEILSEGNASQKQEAENLMNSLNES